MSFMIVQYADFHNWYKNISDDPIEDFAKSNQKRLRATLKVVDATDVSYEIKRIDESFLEWFVPFYEKTIQSKDNPNVYDIRTIIAEKGATIDYYSLTLYEGGTPIGGTIFSDRGNRYSYGYRAFQNEWEHTKLPSTPTFYAEYILAQHSLQNGKHKLSHGKDRNPYGINSGIGLCIFKLSVGCTAALPKTYQTATIDTDTVAENVLVLEKPSDGVRITDAHLCVREADLEKYIQVTKYPEQLQVHIHLR